MFPRASLCALLWLPLIGCSTYLDPIDSQALQAFDYLNRVRGNPAAFSGEIGIDLSGVAPQRPLAWNKMLARSAMARAQDMAQRNYLSHINPEGIGPNEIARQFGYRFPTWWSNSPSGNNIESIHACEGDCATDGSLSIRAIRQLIRDEGIDPPGHRRQLLGMNEFWASHRDGAVGMASSPGPPERHFLVVHTGLSQ